MLDPDSPLDVGQKPAAAKPHEHHGATPAATEKVEDPVCHMKIDPSKAAGGSLTVDGVKSYFCSSSCRAKFLAEHPEAK